MHSIACVLHLFIHENREFDRHSRLIIDECFAKDDDLALKLLECKAKWLYSCYPLDVARRANCQYFLASNTVQAHLDDKWYYNFDYQRQIMKIPVPFWVCQRF